MPPVRAKTKIGGRIGGLTTPPVAGLFRGPERCAAAFSERAYCLAVTRTWRGKAGTRSARSPLVSGHIHRGGPDELHDDVAHATASAKRSCVRGATADDQLTELAITRRGRKQVGVRARRVSSADSRPRLRAFNSPRRCCSVAGAHYRVRTRLACGGRRTCRIGWSALAPITGRCTRGVRVPWAPRRTGYPC